MASETVSNLPIVDLTKEILKPNTTSWNQACADVRGALEEHGCFLALYDQVPSELNKEVFDLLKDLFDLPLETKVKNSSDLAFYGYVGQLPHAPLHESLGIPDATTVEGVERFSNLMWPSGNKRFCDAVLSYAKSMAELERLVNKMVFQSYGAQKHLEQLVESTTYLLRPIKYTTPQQDTGNSNMGSNIHTDKSFLTIIHQNQVNALRVQARNGEWINVDFPPNSFVIMAGDAYEAWSNGRIKSARHQVIMMKGDKPRYCLTFFSFNQGMIDIPEELVDQLHPLQFKPLDHLGLVKYYLTGKVDMLGSTAKAYCGITVSKLGNCRLYSSMCVAIAYEICQNSSNLILKNI